jgi:antitoxin YokJ
MLNRKAGALIDLDALIARMRITDDCVVHAPQGMPHPSDGHRIPPDVEQFYALCGGGLLFPHSAYTTVIVPPTKFVQINHALYEGDEIIMTGGSQDRSDSWYILAGTGNGNYVSIDLSSEKNGWCYDSSFDGHGVAGSCPILARSFSDFLLATIQKRGGYWYWLEPTFSTLGDAYD